MRNEELAKLTRVKNKHKVKDSTERSDFASWETIGKICRGEQRSPVRSNEISIFHKFV